MVIGVTPYLAVRGAAEAIEYYRAAFDATEEMRLTDEHGRVAHATLKVGDVAIYLADEHPEIDVLGPASRGGTTVTIVLEVDNCDAVFNQAVDAGGAVSRPLADTFEGAMRNGIVMDPFGHRWMILTQFRPLEL
jgi:PhnB protein